MAVSSHVKALHLCPNPACIPRAASLAQSSQFALGLVDTRLVFQLWRRVRVEFSRYHLPHPIKTQLAPPRLYQRRRHGASVAQRCA